MGRYCRSVLAIAFVLVHLLGARNAVADPKLEEAQNHFRQGEAYFKVGTFDKAIEEYEAAYALVPKPGVLFNIGLSYENSGNIDKAVEYYERYLREAPSAGKATEARARREALSRAIAERDQASANTKEALAKRVAGLQAAAASDWDTAIAEFTESFRLAGEPEVVFDLAEAYRAKGDMVLAKAEYERYLALATTGKNRMQAGRRIQEIDGGTSANTGSITTKPPQPMQPAARKSLMPSVVAFSASGVAATVGIFFGLRSSTTDTELGDQLVSGVPPLDTGDPRYAEGKRDALVANISFAVAGAAAIAGGVLLYRALTSKPAPREVSRTIIVPTASDHHAGFAMEVTF